MNLEGMGAAVLGGGSDADVVAAMHTLSRCVFALHAVAAMLELSRANSGRSVLEPRWQVAPAYAFCRGRCACALQYEQLPPPLPPGCLKDPSDCILFFV